MEKVFRVAFNQFYDLVTPARFVQLRQLYGNAAAAWERMSLADLRSLGFSEEKASKLMRSKAALRPSRLYEQITTRGLSVLVPGDGEYPRLLESIPDAPYVLYVRGDPKVLCRPLLAVVGSRQMTAYGRQAVESLIGPLVAAGLGIVSGLAFGVDRAVLDLTAASGGAGVGVLASGVDRITPAGNWDCGQRLLAAGGALVSDFPPGTTPERHYFPFRNRIISGLALGVLVIEAAVKSGTMHTVDAALNQGRTVFSVPGPIFSPFSQGTNRLIKEGAVPVTAPEDILENLVGVKLG